MFHFYFSSFLFLSYFLEVLSNLNLTFKLLSSFIFSFGVMFSFCKINCGLWIFFFSFFHLLLLLNKFLFAFCECNLLSYISNGIVLFLWNFLPLPVVCLGFLFLYLFNICLAERFWWNIWQPLGRRSTEKLSRSCVCYNCLAGEVSWGNHKYQFPWWFSLDWSVFL